MASAVCLAGCGFHGLSLQSLPKLGEVTSPTYPIYAKFANVLNLPVEGQVRVGPQVVGEVSGISAQDFVAIVTMRIEKSVTLLQGTTAQVRFDNPL
jgi:phospholipid/cholesterol/gamma-HCH transport system substrate-binding protein